MNYVKGIWSDTHPFSLPVYKLLSYFPTFSPAPPPQKKTAFLYENNYQIACVIQDFSYAMHRSWEIENLAMDEGRDGQAGEPNRHV